MLQWISRGSKVVPGGFRSIPWGFIHGVVPVDFREFQKRSRGFQVVSGAFQGVSGVLQRVSGTFHSIPAAFGYIPRVSIGFKDILGVFKGFQVYFREFHG